MNAPLVNILAKSYELINKISVNISIQIAPIPQTLTNLNTLKSRPTLTFSEDCLTIRKQFIINLIEITIHLITCSTFLVSKHLLSLMMEGALNID